MGIFDKIAEWLIPGPAAGQVAVSAAQIPGAESIAVAAPILVAYQEWRAAKKGTNGMVVRAKA